MKKILILLAMTVSASTYGSDDIDCFYAKSEAELNIGIQQVQQKEKQIYKWLSEFKANCLTAKPDSLQRELCQQMQRVQQQLQQCVQLQDQPRNNKLN